MSKISSLQELYVDELKDLWSANDQMVRALTKIAPQAQNPTLVAKLRRRDASTHYKLAMSITNRYFTSPLSMRS